MSTTVDTTALKDAHRRTWASGDYPLVAELVTAVGERVVARAGVAHRRGGARRRRRERQRRDPRCPRRRARDRLRPHPGALRRRPPPRRRGGRGDRVDRRRRRGPAVRGRALRPRALEPRRAVRAAPRGRRRASSSASAGPAGTIALGNWAADSYIGRFWTTMGPYMPKPPEYASPPPGWGRVEHVQRLFADQPVDLSIERRTLYFEDASPEAFIDLFADDYGPLLQARLKLAPTALARAARGTDRAQRPREYRTPTAASARRATTSSSSPASGADQASSAVGS